ncbi:MAG: polyphosphate polymerase domain-containing protein [Bacteroidetes bacterium]|nr:polyphosphate polymerase domain-containing protein [Bacteroidota bacterium]
MNKESLIRKLLEIFEPISLEKMDRVALLDRTDTKYVLNENILQNILPELAKYYYVLDIDNCRCFDYQSLYFDSPELKFFYEHHCGLANRYKIRYRKYVQSNLHFFEIKFKNNKGRTIKKRVMTDGIGANLGEKEINLLSSLTPYKASELQPSAKIDYARMTLISKNMDERVTIDVNLEAGLDNGMKPAEHLVIVEVKQAKFNYSSPVNRMLKLRHYLPASLSKYCWAIMSIHPNIKKNNFKMQIHYMNKVINKINF